jgi:hypothetical protein
MPFFRHLPAPLFAVALATASPALLADITLQYSDGNGTSGSRVMIKDEIVRLEERLEDGAVIYSLYDSKRRTLTMVMDEERSYSELTEEGLKAQAGEMRAMQQEFLQQMRQQMAQMPPEQRQMMEQQMAQMGIDPAMLSGEAPPVRDSSDIETRNTGERIEISGIPCERLDVLLDGKRTNEMCVASPSAMDMSDEDYSTLRNLFEFMQRLSDIALSMGGPAAAEIGAEMLPVVDGVPVRVHNLMDSTVVTLESTSIETLPVEIFRVPTGYQQVDPF